MTATRLSPAVHGKPVGLEVAVYLLRHGPFPVHRPASKLGIINVRVALVHWFGDDRGLPSFGASTGISLLL